MDKSRNDILHWQHAVVETLKTHLESDQSVLGLIVTGSLGQHGGTPDEWSDVDIVLVVADDVCECYNSTTGWLESIGQPYAIAVSGAAPVVSRRIYFADGRRLDVTIVREHDIEQLGAIRFGARALFSRSTMLDRLLSEEIASLSPKPVDPEQIERMANDFRFKAMLATHKVARDDLLVALHLSLDLVRDVAVLGMLLRDKDLRTDHHRWGSAGQRYIDEIQSASQPYTHEGILNIIGESAITFDDLASRLWKGYKGDCGPVVNWVERVKKSIRP